MHWAPTGTASIVLLLCHGAGSQAPARPASRVWQADIQIRTLEVTKTRTSLNTRIVVYTEHDDDARDARLLILLPVGVGIERLAPGCAATAGPSNIPALRAAVTCQLGDLPNRGYREVTITTTRPFDGKPKRIGVFTYSLTPDPAPGNNHADRTIP